jgi:hypothetical protein
MYTLYLKNGQRSRGKLSRDCQAVAQQQMRPTGAPIQRVARVERTMISIIGKILVGGVLKGYF